MARARRVPRHRAMCRVTQLPSSSYRAEGGAQTVRAHCTHSSGVPSGSSRVQGPAGLPTAGHLQGAFPSPRSIAHDPQPARTAWSDCDTRGSFEEASAGSGSSAGPPRERPSEHSLRCHAAPGRAASRGFRRPGTAHASGGVNVGHGGRPYRPCSDNTEPSPTPLDSARSGTPTGVCFSRRDIF